MATTIGNIQCTYSAKILLYCTVDLYCSICDISLTLPVHNLEKIKSMYGHSFLYSKFIFVLKIKKVKGIRSSVYEVPTMSTNSNANNSETAPSHCSISSFTRIYNNGSIWTPQTHPWY